LWRAGGVFSESAEKKRQESDDRREAREEPVFFAERIVDRNDAADESLNQTRPADGFEQL
jgi:hypothetical protein